MSIWFNREVDLPKLNANRGETMIDALNITFSAFGDDWLTARMPVGPATRQPHGRLHGGASVALAETVASTAGALTLDPARQGVVGLEISANHIRPVSQGFVFATAHAEALGQRVQVWTIRIVDEAEKLVCLSRITLAVIELDRMRVSGEAS